MIWRIEHLPHGRVVGTCKTCGHATLHPNLRTAEMWARRHDVVTCVMTKQTRDAAQTPVAGSLAASHVENDYAPTQTTAALTGAVTTSEEIAS